jgi:hypothetical protein
MKKICAIAILLGIWSNSAWPETESNSSENGSSATREDKTSVYETKSGMTVDFHSKTEVINGGRLDTQGNPQKTGPISEKIETYGVGVTMPSNIGK